MKLPALTDGVSPFSALRAVPRHAYLVVWHTLLSQPHLHPPYLRKILCPIFLRCPNTPSRAFRKIFSLLFLTYSSLLHLQFVILHILVEWSPVSVYGLGPFLSQLCIGQENIFRYFAIFGANIHPLPCTGFFACISLPRQRDTVFGIPCVPFSTFAFLSLAWRGLRLSPPPSRTGSSRCIRKIIQQL